MALSRFTSDYVGTSEANHGIRSANVKRALYSSMYGAGRNLQSVSQLPNFNRTDWALKLRQQVSKVDSYQLSLPYLFCEANQVHSIDQVLVMRLALCSPLPQTTFALCQVPERMNESRHRVANNQLKSRLINSNQCYLHLKET